MAVVQYGPGWWFPRWWFERHKAVDDRVVKSHRAYFSSGVFAETPLEKFFHPFLGLNSDCPNSAQT